MRKKIVCILTVLVFMFSLGIIGCRKAGTRYNLVSFTGLGVTEQAYEYNYIELYEDGTYHLENKAKANGIVTQQNGKYLVKEDGAVVLSESDNGVNYFLGAGETITCINGRLTLTVFFSGYGQVTMVFVA